MKPLSIECPNLTCIINQSQPEWYRTEYVLGKSSKDAVINSILPRKTENDYQISKFYISRYIIASIEKIHVCGSI